MQIGDKPIKMAQINYLCINKKLRSKRLAPVLIKEITRRINALNVWQAIYTAGVVIPRPIATASYYHRSLNPKKLIDLGFSALPAGESMAEHIKKNKIPTESDIALHGFARVMTSKDLPQVYKLLNEELKKY